LSLSKGNFLFSGEEILEVFALNTSISHVRFIWNGRCYNEIGDLAISE